MEALLVTRGYSRIQMTLPSNALSSYLAWKCIMKDSNGDSVGIPTQEYNW